jgi:hypothetical protein
LHFFKHTPNDVFSAEALESIVSKTIEKNTELSKESVTAKIFVECSVVLYFILVDVLALCDFEVNPLYACMNKSDDFFITALSSNYVLLQAPPNLFFYFVEYNGTHTLSSVQYPVRK